MVSRSTAELMTDTEYLTATEAAAICRYSRPSSFLRAYRALGFEAVKPRGRCLIRREDFEEFLSHISAQESTYDTVPRGT